MASVTGEAIDEVVDKLKAQLRGTLIQPGDAGYDAARQIWNATIDRRPAVIVRCAGVADVVATVGIARDHGLPLSIRGGGHNIAGSALCDDGVVLDLSMMKSVRIDPDARRAYVEPGATLADFDHEAQHFGLATPLGINSTTGVAGLTLGGGFGWISRKFGTTIDNLLAVDMVTAEGKRIRANATEHADLFWAVRGGGGNFGVVTLFEFALHPVGPEIYGGLVVYPLDQGVDVLRRYRAIVDTAPDDLTVWAVLRPAPPLPFLPEQVHGKPVIAIANCYIGDVANGPDAIAPLRHLGTPLGEHLGPMPFVAWQKAFDPLLAPGARNYWKSHNFTTLPDALIDTILRFAAKPPSPHCEVFIGSLGAQINRIAIDATPYASRDARFIVNIHGRWTDVSDDATCIGWSRELFSAMTPFATGGVYVNFMTAEEDARVSAAYGPNYARLAKIKTQYDPRNLFRSNQNIKPAAA
ncbi:MAG TPA: FAD-binding oxidoreductase [Pararobbsia sp.]|nr:FAD-binding oxidoreductase [Pararobbsia sp.]